MLTGPPLARYCAETPAGGGPVDRRPVEVADDPDARIVLTWPEDVIRRAAAWLPGAGDGERPPLEDAELLQLHGLLTADGVLTRIGRRFADALGRETWQQADVA